MSVIKKQSEESSKTLRNFFSDSLRFSNSFILENFLRNNKIPYPDTVLIIKIAA